MKLWLKRLNEEWKRKQRTWVLEEIRRKIKEEYPPKRDEDRNR